MRRGPAGRPRSARGRCGSRGSVDRVDEVVAVELGVEADDAAARAARRAAPRARGRCRSARRWATGCARSVRIVARGSRSRIIRGREREVVVLHEDDRVVGVDLLADRVGEPLVDRLVVLPVLAAEDRPGVGDVAERPEALVGEAVVVALLLLGREPDAAERRRTPRPAAPAPGRCSSTVSRSARAAAVGDPDAGAGPHHRLEGGHQAARRVDAPRRRRRSRARGCRARGSRR